MCGKATLAMEVSSTSMKAANATVMAMSHGLTRGFQAVVAEGSGFAILVGTAPLPAGVGDAVSNCGKKLLLQAAGFRIRKNARSTRVERAAEAALNIGLFRGI